MKKKLRVTLILGGLLLCSQLSAGQEYGEIPERYLDLERLDSGERYVHELPDARSPEIAEAALKVVEAYLVSDGRVSVTLRNDSSRTITAWAVGVVLGESDGSSRHSAHSEDHYAFESKGDIGPLQPGDFRSLQYVVGIAMSPSQRPSGPYSVLHVMTKSVMFDDGEFFGSDLTEMKHLIQRRFIRSVVLSGMVGRLEEALQAGSPELFLDEALVRYKGTQSFDGFDGAFVGGVQSIASQVVDMLTMESLQVLQYAVVRFGEIPDLKSSLEDLGELRSSPRVLRRAAQDTLRYLTDELDMVNKHLPVSLRAETVR